MSLVTIPNMRRAASPFSSLKLNFTLNALDPRITFSRTTNATVTNSAGVITYAPHNLITNSEQFDNAAWTKINATVLTNANVAPNGTITADAMIANSGATSSIVQSQTLTAGVTYSYSVYAKYNGETYLRLQCNNGSSFAFADLNTQTGVIGSPSGTLTNLSSAVTSVGNGWYRAVLTFTASTTGGCIIYLNGLVAGNGYSGIFIWGAQLEIGSTATTYNSTTVKNLLGYSELFDNAAWTKSNSFVQTNLLTYSEAFDNAAWTKQQSTISSNSEIAPNGYQTADKLVEDTSVSNFHGVSGTVITTVSGASYTQSVYAKASEREWIRLLFSAAGFGSSLVAFFNVRTGVLGTVSAGVTASIESVGNGWFRCKATATATASGSYAMGVLLGFADNTVFYTGNGTSGLFIWGAQLVQGSVAGDYRRTDAAALPVYYPNHNGVVCAEKLVVDSAVGAKYIFQNTTQILNTPLTLSCYLKKAELQYAFLYNAQNNIGRVFNLNDGTSSGLAGITAPTSYSIIPIGDSWYRCSITYPAASGGNGSRIYALSTSSSLSVTGDGTSGIYIFGAQLSDSASLDPYVLNAAAAPSAQAYYGARFDYDPVTLAPKGLLIEEQRSNLLVNSLLAGGGSAPTSWSFTVGTGTSSPVASTKSSIGVAYSQVATAQRPFIGQSVTLAATTVYTISMIVESVSGLTYSQILAVSGITPSSYRINGQTVLSSLTATTGILEATFTSAGAGAVEIRYGIGGSGSATGTLTFSCPQLEAGAFATSYIPTAASQVTRAADIATIQGSNFYSWYNQNEGSIVLKALINTGNAGSYQYVINDGTGNNYIRVGNNTNTVNAQLAANGTNTVNIQTNIGIPNNYENIVAFAYKINDVAACGKPNNIVLDASNTPPIVSQLLLGASNNNTIKSISYYPQRLSDSVLKGLTA